MIGYDEHKDSSELEELVDVITEVFFVLVLGSPASH